LKPWHGFASIPERLSLRARLLWAFALIMTLGLVPVAIIEESEEGALEVLERIVNTDMRVSDLALRGVASFLDARRHEKDFLLRYREFGFREARARYVTQVQTSVAELHEQMQELRKVAGDRDTRETTGKIELAAAEYLANFLQTVELYELLAIPHRGLQAKLRGTLGALSPAASARSEPRLAAAYLDLYRAAHGMIDDAGPAEYDRAMQQLAAFERVAIAALPAGARAAFAAQTGLFGDTATGVLNASTGIAQHRSAYLEAAKRVEPLLDALHITRVKAGEDALAAAREHAKLTDRYAIASSAAAFLLTLVLAIVIALSISRGVNSLVAYTGEITHGHLDARAPKLGDKELGQIAAALDTMAGRLRESRDSLTARNADLANANAAMQAEITERKRSEVELQRVQSELERRIADSTTANDSLQRQTEELRRLNAERAALGRMNELLTACAGPDEAYEIFGRAAAGLFPSLSGALHILAASRNQLTPAATWGTWPDAPTPANPESCWGLRRGNCYVGNGTTSPPCGHAGPARELATLCATLTAYGEVLGVLHLRGPDAAQVQSALQLATMAGDGLALTLANLRLRESLKAQSIRDPLTGLFNRRYLTETLEREFARAQRTGAPVAVMMIDVDHFKRFNDNFGHSAGDAVLRELGEFLKRSIRAEDIACRYGGEEFCLVLPQMARDGARQRAEDIRAGVARLEVRSGDRVLEPVTLSLGVALFPQDAVEPNALLRAADEAMYQAKKSGRNRVVAATVAAPAEARADA
jgi:diguanylate cyclase (GGDEF)-like protein